MTQAIPVPMHDLFAGAEQQLASAQKVVDCSISQLKVPSCMTLLGCRLPEGTDAVFDVHLQGMADDPAALARIGECDGQKMLQLLRSCSGAFRPGILTALVGSSGAGKTTLMDCLAGRKTSACHVYEL